MSLDVCDLHYNTYNYNTYTYTIKKTWGYKNRHWSNHVTQVQLSMIQLISLQIQLEIIPYKS